MRPFDSGTNFFTNNTPRIQITPNIAKTNCCEKYAVIIGKSNPTKNDPTQFNDEAVPEAKPLIANGNISPTMTHVNGAQVND